MHIKEISLLAIGASLALGLPASAETRHRNVDSVEVEDFIGTVRIEPGVGRDARLDISDGTKADYPVRVAMQNGVLTIHSDENPDDTRWWDDVNWRKHNEKAFEVFLQSYPTITLTVPVGAGLSFDSAVISLAAGDTKGDLRVRKGHVNGHIGDIKTADVAIHGSGDLTTGAISGDLDISIHGSGDFAAISAATVEAMVHGSGDIDIGNVAGDATTGIHGSGDVVLGDIDGPLIASIHGSGDIETGKVRGGAATSINGSGDISLASINGDASAEIHGSGDIDIRAGRAENLRVEIHGSGGFEMHGTATNPEIDANRSGEVYIKRHEGSVRVHGDGDVEISGVEYGDDD